MENLPGLGVSIVCPDSMAVSHSSQPSKVLKTAVGSLGLGPNASRHGGSSPSARTNLKVPNGTAHFAPDGAFPFRRDEPNGEDYWPLSARTGAAIGFPMNSANAPIETSGLSASTLCAAHTSYPMMLR